MGNHTVNCQICKEDLKGLSGGHAPGCPGPSEQKFRFQIDLPPRQKDTFNNLMEHCKFGSRKDLFNAALTILHWATEEISKGRKIASYDEKTDNIETLILQALKDVPLNEVKRNESKKEMEEFKVGDVVYLKSGSPAMTITSKKDGRDFYHTTWFNEEDDVKTTLLHESTLTKKAPRQFMAD